LRASTASITSPNNLDWDIPRLAASAAKRAFFSGPGQAVMLERVGFISAVYKYSHTVFVRRQSILHSTPKQAFSFGMPKVSLSARDVMVRQPA
jgi:hypothetical protein